MSTPSPRHTIAIDATDARRVLVGVCLRLRCVTAATLDRRLWNTIFHAGKRAEAAEGRAEDAKKKTAAAEKKAAAAEKRASKAEAKVEHMRRRMRQILQPEIVDLAATVHRNGRCGHVSAAVSCENALHARTGGRRHDHRAEARRHESPWGGRG